MTLFEAVSEDIRWQAVKYNLRIDVEDQINRMDNVTFLRVISEQLEGVIHDAINEAKRGDA